MHSSSSSSPSCSSFISSKVQQIINRYPKILKCRVRIVRLEEDPQLKSSQLPQQPQVHMDQHDSEEDEEGPITPRRPGTKVGSGKSVKRKWRIESDSEDSAEDSDSDPDYLGGESDLLTKSKVRKGPTSVRHVHSTTLSAALPRKPSSVPSVHGSIQGTSQNPRRDEGARASKLHTPNRRRRPNIRRKRRGPHTFGDEFILPEETGFDRGLTAIRVLGVQDSLQDPDSYCYVVEFADPQPGKPNHFSYEFVPKSLMHSTDERARLIMDFYLSRLHWMGKIERPDINSLELGLQNEHRRLETEVRDEVFTTRSHVSQPSQQQQQRRKTQRNEDNGTNDTSVSNFSDTVIEIHSEVSTSQGLEHHEHEVSFVGGEEFNESMDADTW